MSDTCYTDVSFSDRTVDSDRSSWHEIINKFVKLNQECFDEGLERASGFVGEGRNIKLTIFRHDSGAGLWSHGGGQGDGEGSEEEE